MREAVTYIPKIAKLLWRDIIRCDLTGHATRMAYTTVFSIVPLLAFVFSLISLFTPIAGEQGKILTTVRQFVLENLAAGSGEQVVQYIEQSLANLDMTKIGISGFAGALIGIILLLKQIEEALNRIWLVTTNRNMVMRFVYFWTILTLGTFTGLMALGVLSGFDLQSLFGFGEIARVDRGFFSKVIPFLMTFAFFFLLYKVVPNTYVSFKQAFIGALPAVILFTLAARFYGIYITRFTSYQKVYGSLAAIPSFLLWINFLWIILLFGALLSWRAQQGLADLEKTDEKAVSLTPSEKMRNHQLQSLVPYIIVLAIYQRHSIGEGKGVSGVDLCSQLNLPAPWIRESLEALRDRGLIVMAHDDAKIQEGIDTMKGNYFPAFPANALPFNQLDRTLSEPAQSWIDEWEHQWPVDLKTALNDVLATRAKAFPTANLVEIFGRLPQGPAAAASV